MLEKKYRGHNFDKVTLIVIMPINKRVLNVKYNLTTDYLYLLCMYYS